MGLLIDREKVIKGLQIERECVSRDCDRDCGKCDLVQERDWLLSAYDDAIALLKEQEAIQVPEDKINKCECGETVCRYWHPKFCGFCGRKLLWY